MDDQSNLYQKDTVSRLVELLQGTFGDEYTYFEATPTTRPPDSSYPLFIVQKLSGTTELGPTQTDDIHEEIAISLWLNRADDIGSDNIRTTTMRHLQNIVEGQSPVTGGYLPNTVMHAIRTNMTLINGNIAGLPIVWTIESSPVRIKYDLFPIKDAPSLCAADIIISTWRRTIVANRQ